MIIHTGGAGAEVLSISKFITPSLIRVGGNDYRNMSQRWEPFDATSGGKLKCLE